MELNPRELRLIDAAEAGDAGVVRDCLAAGADMYAGHDRSAMLLAIINGRTAVVETLLTAGYDPDFDPWGNRVTPLMRACRYGQVEIAALLIERGADIDVRDSKADNALCYALQYDCRPAVDLLLEARADTEIAALYAPCIAQRIPERQPIVDYFLKYLADNAPGSDAFAQSSVILKEPMAVSAPLRLKKAPKAGL